MHSDTKTKETEKEEEEAEDEKDVSLSFMASVLIQKWCRHQYLKGLFPTIVAFWYWSLFYLNFDYEVKASDYINNQLSEYNCTTFSSVELSSDSDFSCYNLNSDNQYYSSTDTGISLVTVNCTESGADLYYPNDYYEAYGNDFYVQLVINFILPVILTYFIYETAYLALRDCLIITPGVNEEGKPILHFVKRPLRVSFFFLRKCFGENEEEEALCEKRNDKEGEPKGSNEIANADLQRREDVMKIPFTKYPETDPESTAEINSSLSPKTSVNLPGIRVGRIYAFAINLFSALSIATVVTFSESDGSVTRCIERSNADLMGGRLLIYSLLGIYLLVAVIPSVWYYYYLFFHLQDIELLAHSYHKEFQKRRVRKMRSFLDIIPALFFPTPIFAAYWSMWLLPNYAIYYLLKGFIFFFWHLRCCGVEDSHQIVFDRKFGEYFKFAFDSNIFYRRITWCGRKLLEGEAVEGRELIRDIHQKRS